MRRRIVRSLLGAIGAVVLLSSASGTALAGNLSISEQRFSATWTNLTIDAGIDFACPVRIEGTFHTRTIRKVINSLVGHVTGADVDGACIGAGARATVLHSSLPWHITYAGFTGTLPRISGVRLRISGMALEAQTSFGDCLIQTTAANPLEGIVKIDRTETGIVTGLTANELVEIPLGAACLSIGDVSFSATASVADASGDPIVVRLI